MVSAISAKKYFLTGFPPFLHLDTKEEIVMVGPDFSLAFVR
jgi:hypothetical protein